MEKKSVQDNLERQLLEAKMETQEETLSVLGKELHDNIGQLLNSTKLLIGVSQRQISNPPDTLSIADETLGRAIQELRSLSKSLNKEWLEKFDLNENLRIETERLNAAGVIQFSLHNNDKILLSSNEQIMLFRIVQEAMQNAIKHAQALHISISLNMEKDRLTAIVTDDGTGFVQETTSLNGVGILNMKHRTQLLGGSIAWESGTEAGTVVTIQIPIK